MEAEEAIVVEFRRRILLPLGGVLAAPARHSRDNGLLASHQRARRYGRRP
jgi:hypothetical protein